MRYLCQDKRRTFKILRTLPFFGALCDTESISGTVLFDPSIESTDLLRAWIVYRDPAQERWSETVTRPRLVRAVARNMLLHTSPCLGMFVNFNPDLVSVSEKECAEDTRVLLGLYLQLVSSAIACYKHLKNWTPMSRILSHPRTSIFSFQRWQKLVYQI